MPLIEPEHELIALCRRIFKENPEFERVSFTVVRDDDENTRFSLSRVEVRDADNPE